MTVGLFDEFFGTFRRRDLSFHRIVRPTTCGWEKGQAVSNRRTENWTVKNNHNYVGYTKTGNPYSSVLSPQDSYRDKESWYVSSSPTCFWFDQERVTPTVGQVWVTRLRPTSSLFSSNRSGRPTERMCKVCTKFRRNISLLGGDFVRTYPFVSRCLHTQDQSS